MISFDHSILSDLESARVSLSDFPEDSIVESTTHSKLKSIKMVAYFVTLLLFFVINFYLELFAFRSSILFYSALVILLVNVSVFLSFHFRSCISIRFLHVSIYLLVCVEIGIKLILLSVYFELGPKDFSYEANELYIFLFLHPFIFDYYMEVTSTEKENMKDVRYTCWTLLWFFFIVSIILRASCFGFSDICVVITSPLVAMIAIYCENKINSIVKPTMKTVHDIKPTTISTQLQKHMSRKVLNATLTRNSETLCCKTYCTAYVLTKIKVELNT